MRCSSKVEKDICTKTKPKKRFRKLFATAVGSVAVLGFAAYELNPNGTLGNYSTVAVQKLPLRYVSHLWGKMASYEFPPSIGQWIVRTYASVYKCNLDEMVEPLESYKSLQQFFSRRIKKEARPFVQDGIASPVDGVVMSIHKIEHASDHVDQVKGISYSLSSFLGESAEKLDNVENVQSTDLYHCIIYLAPGDYHGIHSPVDWTIEKRRYFPGYLFPVAPVVVKRIENLFGVNERVVLSGTWKYGYFSLSPVGATNVGSISISGEPKFRSNLRWAKLGNSEEQSYNPPHQGERGEEVAFFHLGSTVVLVWESPELEFDVKVGQKVRMGESIAHFVEQSKE